MKKSLLLTVILIFICSIISYAKEVKKYYPDGTLKYIDHYNNKDQLNGWFKSYYPDGKLKEEGQYKNGIVVGKVKRYYLDGSLISQ